MPLIKTYADIHKILDIINNSDHSICTYCKNSAFCYKNNLSCPGLIEKALALNLWKKKEKPTND